MYGLIKDSLLKPQNLRNYLHVKARYFFLYFVFLVFLFALPDFIFFIRAQSIGPAIIKEVQAAFNAQDVPYTLVNNRLVDAGGAAPVFIDVPGLNVSFLFDLTGALDYQQANHQMILKFGEDRVQFTFKNAPAVAIDVARYDEIPGANLDFRQAVSPSNTEFWNDFIAFAQKVVAKQRFSIIFIGVFSLATSLSLSLLLLILLTAGIIAFINRNMRAGFKPILKITMLAYTPYVFGVLLTVLTGFLFLSSLGSIVSVIYAVIGAKSYLQNQIIDQS